ncbi:hypothetical protein FRC04_010571 [Tulasnella sp. 424]|nr:hypothetical protein FRC04_010571 [Tulasnella sp. 424]
MERLSAHPPPSYGAPLVYLSTRHHTSRAGAHAREASHRKGLFAVASDRPGHTTLLDNHFQRNIAQCRGAQATKGFCIPRLSVEGDAPDFGWDKPTIRFPQDVRTLTLTNIDVSWQSNYFPLLVSLQLSDVIKTTFRRFLAEPIQPSGSNLIAAIFRACPCLKALKLGSFRGRFDTKVDQTLKQGLITPPPCLDSLELRGPSPEFFGHVLDEVDISSLSKLIIYTINPGQNPSDMAAALCWDVGGRSLLQRAIDEANCERLTVSIGRGPTSWIKVNDRGRRIDIELLSRDSSGATDRAILGAIENPVNVEIFGKIDDPLFEYLRGGSTVSDIRRRPYRGRGSGTFETYVL